MVKLEAAVVCRVLSCSETKSETLLQLWQPCEILIFERSWEGIRFRLGRVFAVLGRPTSPKPADSLFFRPLPTVSGEVGPLEGRLLN